VRKKIAIILVLIMWGAVFVAASRYFSNKFVQDAIAYDNQRLYDISINDYHISKYYIDHNQLPNNLDELAASERRDSQHVSPPVLHDPQTEAAYSYKPEADGKYKICTTFSTDTKTDPKLANAYTDYIALQLKRYATSIYHSKGFDCIELSLKGNPNDLSGSVTSDSQLTPFAFITPNHDDKLCLGQDYTLSWTGDKNTNSYGIYLIPPVSMKQPQSWLLNGYSVSPGVIVGSALQGSFIWHVGKLEAGVDKKVPEVVHPGHGTSFGVIARYNNVLQVSYSSDFFEIADCSVHGENK